MAALFSGISHAQVVRNFTPRFTINTKGRMVFVSNNIITTKQRPGGNPVTYTQNPPNCPGGSILCKNDREMNTNIDIDGDPTTFNSSSAALALPDCNSIAFAGLYWGAGVAFNQDENGPAPLGPGGWPWNQVLFKTPAGAYQTITANKVDSINITFQGYQAFADVTNIVRSGGSGMYTVGNVKCDTISASTGRPVKNAYGGWTLVVIYRDANLPLRNMTVFDGFALVRSQAPDNVRTITVTGFKCPPTGNVTTKLGMVVYDGDRGEADGFEVRRNVDNVFKSQTDPGEGASGVANPGDAWNSSITDSNASVTDRIPAHGNTYGYDAHQFTLNNATKQYLRNNDSTAVLRLRTSSEGYVLGVVTSQIDTYEPEMLMENSITYLNGPAIDKGDTLQITSSIRNTGNDVATDVHAETKLPAYFKYVPNSMVLNGVAKSDADGDDEAVYDATTKTVRGNIGAGNSSSAGGSVPGNNTISHTFAYKVTISTDCADIGTTPKALLLQSQLFYAGQATGLADSTASRSTQGGGSCVQPVAPDTLRLLSGCSIALPVKLLAFSGSRSGGSVLLNWRVEEHNDGKNYTIQSSADGVSFTSIYSKDIPLQEGVFAYEFTDAANYPVNVVYYRLIMTSIDGTIEYSRTISIRKNSDIQLDLSPNPVVAGTATLRSSAIIDKLEWYNTSGQLVKTIANPVNGQTIQLGELGNGIYVVKAYKAGETVTFKMIKR